MNEGLTLEALYETLQGFGAGVDLSKIPRVIHILGSDAFYYRALNTLRTDVAITLRSEGAHLVPDTWYGIRIKRHKDHGETDALIVEMANGEVIFLDLTGGDDDDDVEA